MTAELSDRCFSFIGQINRYRTQAGATDLLSAEEACFCPNEHLALVNRRVRDLVDEALRGSFQPQLAEWILRDLRSCFQRQRQQASKAIQTPKDWSYELSRQQRCLSPSDFALHNCVGDSTRLSFIDFEYAGWDDPAKLILDFCLHPQNGLGLDDLSAVAERFRIQLAMKDGQFADLLERIRWLRPLLQVKWACIIIQGATIDRQIRFATSRQAEQEKLQAAQEFLERSFYNCPV